jgi:putative phosphoesterase
MKKTVRAVAVSDTHGNHTSMDRIALAYSKADYLFHLGDNVRDALWLEKNMPDTRVFFVRGNCDPGSPAEDYEEVTIEGNKVILTHGHLLKAKFSYDRLYYYAEERGAKAILFGHTHAAYAENINGIWLINPRQCGGKLSR